jgi:hypothetical protein
LLLTVALAPAAEKTHQWESGKVISQNLESVRDGAVARSFGVAVVAKPLYRRSNTVTIETASYRYQWAEVGNNTIILPVNAEIDFYREKDWFIVLDTKAKKHKFALIGMTAK